MSDQQKYSLPPDDFIGKERIIGYTDPKTNVDYVGMLPSEPEQRWIAEWINKEGLENLCKKYPYQPLRIDKETETLVPCDSTCNYMAKLTNIFHVLYHKRKDKMGIQGDPLLDFDPNKHRVTADFKPVNQKPSVSIQQNDLKSKLVKDDVTNEAYKLNLKEAYHDKKEEIKYDIPLNETSYVYGKDDKQYSFDANKIRDDLFSLNMPEGYQYYHPNLMYQSQQPIQYNNIPQYNAQYNQYYGGASYLPSYSTLPNANMGTFGCFNNAYQAKNAYVYNTNQNIGYMNPNRIEQSTVDFSNPEYLNSMQRPSNPYATVGANPNRTYANQQPQQSGTLVKTFVNPAYNSYVGQPNQFNWGGYSNWNPSINTEWMIPTEEDYEMGLFPRVSIVQVKEEKEITCTDPVKRRTYKDMWDPKQLKVSIYDPNKEKAEEKDDAKPKVEMNINNINSNLARSACRAMDILEGKKDVKPYTYDAAEEEKIEQLADQIAPYDLAIALSLTDAMDAGYSEEDFNLYKEWVEERVEYMRKQEFMFPEIDFKLPYRYRRVPAHTQIGPGKWDIEFLPEPEQEQEIKYDVNGNRLYDYDCGFDFDDSNYEAFNIFFLKAVKDRESIITRKKMEKFANKEGKTDRQIELENRTKMRNMSFDSSLDDDDEIVNPYDPLSVQRYNYKMYQKRMRSQYQVFQTALSKKMTKQEFENWWYRGTTKSQSNKPLTYEERKRARKREIARMTDNNILFLDNSLRDIDYSAIRQYNLQQAASRVREFDQGWMDDCDSLRTFFDKLGYLVYRAREYDHREKMEQVRLQNYQDFNRVGMLHRYFNDPNYPKNLNPNIKFPKLDNPGQYGLPEGSVDFMGLPEYGSKRSRFVDYCRTHMGVTTPLKPIYK